MRGILIQVSEAKLTAGPSLSPGVTIPFFIDAKDFEKCDQFIQDAISLLAEKINTTTS